jgi:hypothetical protein
MAKRKELLIDTSWFKTTQGILTLVAGMIGLIIAVKELWPSSTPEPTTQHVEILLDHSAGMGQMFDGVPKLAAAQEALQKMFKGDIGGLASNDDLAFRGFGGTCGAQDNKLLLGFGKTSERRILDEARGLAPGGRNSLVHAVSEATGDFSRLEKDAIKRIIVITGGGDRCDQDIEALKNRLDSYRQAGGVKLDMHYIGLGLAPEDQEKLAELATATGGEVTLANTREDLGKALYQHLIVEPVVADSRQIIQILNDTVTLTNAALDRLNNKDYAGAEAGLTQAQSKWNSSQPEFEALRQRQRRMESFQRLFENAKIQRQRQEEMLSTMQTLIRDAKAGDADGLALNASRYKNLADQYNEAIGASKQILEKLSIHVS